MSRSSYITRSKSASEETTSTSSPLEKDGESECILSVPFGGTLVPDESSTDRSSDGPPQPEVYVCRICQKDAVTECIQCEGKCSSWLHFQCVGLTDDDVNDIGEDDTWICKDCSMVDTGACLLYTSPSPRD